MAPRSAVDEAAPADDEQVEPAVGRVERLARAEPARDEVAAVADEHEQALDLDGHAVGDEPEVGRLQSGELVDGRPDVRPEAAAAASTPLRRRP